MQHEPVIEPLHLQGACRITPQPATDLRGSFTRLIDAKIFAAHGLETQFHQHAVSWNTLQGTLRGMHFQAPPYAEAKLVRCTRGALYDVLVDIRKDSPTYLQHVALTLTAEKPEMIYIPPGVAHGFLTLSDECEISYHISQPYIATAQQGIRWNDPALGISWPHDARVMSERDRNFADWKL
jgi:dTDP-4-dehydrorhamnose 3,5-epimerase